LGFIGFGATRIRGSIIVSADANTEIQILNRELESRVKQRTAELESTEEQYSYVLENLADGAITIDIEGSIEYVNPMTEKLFGYTAAEMIGKNVSMLMPEPDSGSHDDYLSTYRRTGKSNIMGVGRQVNGQHKDGTVFPLDLNISETIVNGKVTYFGTVRDMTERAQAEQEILQAKLDAETSSQVKSNFLANMSHELRTPLNAIIGFSDVLLEKIFGPLGNEKQEEYVKNIHDSGKHLLDLISDILDVSAIEADKLEINETDVNLRETVDASFILVTPRAQQGQVGLKSNFQGLNPIVRADERRMKQILVNLLSNAIKFTKSGGLITAETETFEDGSMTISVTDNGIGMTPEGIGYAMEPFGQVKQDETLPHEGTGLGLPLTKMLVEAHGFDFSIESEPNIGTTIKVSFPKEKVVSI
jgi:PAS domain S-box-containing protein